MKTRGGDPCKTTRLGQLKHAFCILSTIPSKRRVLLLYFKKHRLKNEPSLLFCFVFYI